MEWKSYTSEIKDANQNDLTITHVISTSHRDRSGDRLHPEGAVIEGKPVFLWQHGVDDRVGKEPIGKPLSIKVGDHRGEKALIAKSQFYPDDFGRRLWEKATKGYLSSFSIGFIPLESTPFQDGGRDITKFDVLEYSLCAVPCNPYATMLNQDKAIASMVFKMASEGRRDLPSKRMEYITEHDIIVRVDEAKGTVTIPDDALQNLIKRVVKKEVDRAKGRVE